MCAVQPTSKDGKKAEPRKPDDKNPSQVGEADMRKYVQDLQGVKDDVKEALLKLLLKYRWVFRTDLTGPSWSR